MVTGIADPFDEACSGTAVDELDGAVVAQQEVIGDVSDRRAVALDLGEPIAGRVAAHRQQQLVLGTGQADAPGLRLAPPEESAEPITEVEEAGEVGVRQPLGGAARRVHIVTR